MTEIMIEVEGLSKDYGAVKALCGVSFSVPRGQVVGLLGPNGAGKTTAMRILTGFVAPTDGQARVAGLDVVEDTPAARRQIGYLPEGNPLYHDLRVEEALEFTASLHGLKGKARKDAAKRSSETAGLTGMSRRLVGTLSKGLKQRVGLAQALMHEPDVLVLDEPTSGLDPNQQEDMRGLIRTLGAERTVILSTHILPEVEAVCDRALIINEGRLVADGTVNDIKRQQSEGARAHLVVRGTESGIEEALGGAERELRIEPAAAEGGLFHVRTTLRDKDERAELEQLAQAIAGAGLGLSHLEAERASLEQIFAHLTLDAHDEEGDER